MRTQCQLHVESVRKVFDDGNHSAFTDLCRFGNRIYLTFRSCPDGHEIFPSSSIIVMRSNDGDEWQEVSTFHVRDRDVRDPHFLVFHDALFVYTGTWLCDPAEPEKRDLNDHLGYGVRTTDGEQWEGPRLLEGTYGHYVWRAATYGGKAYLNGRRKREIAHNAGTGDGVETTESALLDSEDGWVWKATGLFTETYSDETAFLFEDDGSILAIARGNGPQSARVCRSCPPYKQWTRVNLDRNIGGPLLAKWGDRYLVGGRRYDSDGKRVTALYWLVGDELVPAAELPSGGDNSYPGFVPFNDAQGLLSYYSSHEGSGDTSPPSAIYLANLSLR